MRLRSTPEAKLRHALRLWQASGEDSQSRAVVVAPTLDRAFARWCLAVE
jgi:hypothetical protein